jgi:hypothetical protein
MSISEFLNWNAQKVFTEMMFLKNICPNALAVCWAAPSQNLGQDTDDKSLRQYHEHPFRSEKGDGSLYLLNDMKPRISVDDRVECPILGCTHTVERQTKIMEKEERFRCPYHDIYISPSTFEYRDAARNLLWNDRDDLRYLEQVLAEKTESRMGRERSEDAVTWNVFRYLQKHHHVYRFVKAFTGLSAYDPELIFWSYSPLAAGKWEPLLRASQAFGERKGYGSEPDMIINSEDMIIFIEAKFTSGNETVGNSEAALIRYSESENRWYEKVFAADIWNVAVESKKYELMRYWLLGTWIANEMGKHFVLMSVTPIDRERDLPGQFKRLIRETNNREYRHTCWEEVRSFINQNLQSSGERNKVIRYLDGKTAGYVNGVLQKAFRCGE